MPAINACKIYVNGGYYHVYNRGVFKLQIFHSASDYLQFRQILRYEIEKKCYEIRLIYYVIMPNHFHLQVQQLTPRGMVSFMQSVMIRYTLYYHKKYMTCGRIFQSVYRASYLLSEQQRDDNLAYLKKNPQRAGLTDWPYAGSYP